MNDSIHTPQDVPLKQCRDCKTWLPATPEHFNKTALYVSPDGLSKQCKTCRQSYRKNYQKQPKPSVPEGYKRCARCEQPLPATSEYFHADRKKKDGLDYTCKQCSNQSRRKKAPKSFDPTRMKQCPKCKQVLPATLQYFHSHSKYADGLYPRCKTCRRSMSEEYRLHPPTPVPDGYKRCARCKQEYPATTEYFFEGKHHMDGLRGTCKSCCKRYSKIDDTRIFVYAGEKTCSKCKQSKPATPDYFHVNRKARDGLAFVCRDCESAYYRHYSLTHPDVVKARRDRRRAHLRNNEGNYTPEQIQNLLKQQKYQCYYCSKKFEKSKGRYVYHIDHTFPLSRVANMPANSIDYLVVSCPRCNRRKGNKFPWEFFEGGRLL